MLPPSVAHVGGVGVEPHMLGIPASLVFSHSEGEGLFPSHACSMESCAVVGLHWASRSSSGSSGHVQQRCSDSGKEFIWQDIILIVCPMLAYRKHLPNDRNEHDDSEWWSGGVSLMKLRIWQLVLCVLTLLPLHLVLVDSGTHQISISLNLQDKHFQHFLK